MENVCFSRKTRKFWTENSTSIRVPRYSVSCESGYRVQETDMQEWIVSKVVVDFQSGCGRSGEAVRRLRYERGKQIVSNRRGRCCKNRIIDEVSPFELPVAGQRLVGRFGREIGKAGWAENMRHSAIRVAIVSDAAMNARKRLVMQRGRRSRGFEADRLSHMRNSFGGDRSRMRARWMVAVSGMLSMFQRARKCRHF